MLPRLGQQPPIENGLRDWILSGHYTVRPISPSGLVQLEISGLDFLVRHIAFDFERFSLASLESFVVVGLEKQANNFAAWPLLKLYYSSFFAAHAIMRSQGAGVTLLSHQHVNYVNSIIDLLHPGTPNLSAGMYLYKTDSAHNGGVANVSLQKTQENGGGVHESFWKTFCRYLADDAAYAVTSGAADSTEYVAGADTLSRAILEGGLGGGAWISSIRNEINYQHKHETWYPLRRNAKAINAISGISTMPSDAIRLDLSKQRDLIVAFRNVCHYLACLNIEVSNYLAASSTQARAFGQRWRRLSRVL